MIDLLCDKDWRGNAWQSSTSGDGVTSDSAGILTTTTTTGVAERRMWIPVEPGTVIELEVLARLVTGSPSVALHTATHNTISATGAQIGVTGTDWKPYTLRYIVPMSESSDIKFIVARFGALSAGDARFQLPTLRIGQGLGLPLIVARGTIQLASGTPSVMTSRVNHGIASVAFNGSDTLTVTLQHALPSGGLVLPAVFLQGEQGQPTRIPFVGSVVGGTSPTVQIKWTNGAAIQNVSSGTTFVYFMVLW